MAIGFRFLPLAGGAAAPADDQFTWRQPLAEPARHRALPTAVVVAAGLFWAPQPVPTVTPDQFQRPLSEPVRMAPRAQPAAVVNAPPYIEPAAEDVTADKWYAELSTPVRVRPALLAALQQSTAFTKADPFPEAVTVDKWLLSLAEPVRVPPRLIAGAQPWLAFAKADPFPEATDAGKWYAPLAEPIVKARPGLAASSQQFLALGQPEPLSAQRWFAPLSEPVRVRPALLAALQQSLAFVKAAPFPESVTVDRWLLPLQEPVRLRPQLATGQQQFTAFWPFPLPNIDAPVGFYPTYPDRAPGRALLTAQQQAVAFVKAAPFPETVTADRWAQPLSEPIVKARPGLAASSQQFLALGQPEPLSAQRWFVPLSEPVRTRPALLAAQQQSLAFVKAAPFPETVTVDRWLLNLSEPQRPPLGLAVRLQQSLALWPYPLPNVDAPVGFYGVFPDRAPGRALPTAQQQALAFVKAAPFPETVTADRWAQPLSEPTRRISSPAWQQAAITGPALPFVVGADRWYQAFSTPLVTRRAQQASPAFVAVVSTAETVTTDKWYSPWQAPARRTLFISGYQASIAGPALPIVASPPDRWLVAFGEPVRRILRQTAGAVQATYFSATGTAADIAWYVSLSEPTRPIWSVAWRPAYFAPLSYIAGLAIPRVGNGVVDIFGPSLGLPIDRTADGLPVARVADGLPVPRS